MDEAHSNISDRVCDNCGTWVEENEILYHMTVTLMAEPRIRLDDHLQSGKLGTFEEELQKLIKQMEKMDDDQIQEATDQVFEEYRLNLCPACRKQIHNQFKPRKQLEKRYPGPMEGDSPDASESD